MSLADQRKRLCAYIRNTGQVPLPATDFDDDWSPAGEMYRDDLVEQGLIVIREPAPATDDMAEEPGGIHLTDTGEALL